MLSHPVDGRVLQASHWQGTPTRRACDTSSMLHRRCRSQLHHQAQYSPCLPAMRRTVTLHTPYLHTRDSTQRGPRFRSRALTALSSASLVRDVRPMPIKIITVSKGNSPGATLMGDEWLEKLRRYTTVTEVQIKPNPKKAASVEIQKQAEAEKVLKSISPQEHVVLLDERGAELTSEALAKLIAKAGDRGSPLCFCIGGPFGHGDGVRERANESIRLSVMVLNHQVAHIVLLEQLYRAWTILRGEPYHH